MSRYHINDKGEPGVCRARQNCPFGAADAHYDSPQLARQAYEASASGTYLLGAGKDGEEVGSNYLTDEAMEEFSASFEDADEAAWDSARPFIPADVRPPF